MAIISSAEKLIPAKLKLFALLPLLALVRDTMLSRN